jgi:hypothetical protein
VGRSVTRSVADQWGTTTSEARSFDEELDDTGSTVSSGGSNARTAGSAVAFSTGQTVGRSNSHSRSHAFGTTEGKSAATTRGQSVGVTRGRSVGTTTTVGETDGITITEGGAEGLEPIYEVLPNAVHSIENVRYVAAQALRGLPTGQAFVNLVTPEGMQAARVIVPEIRCRELSDEEFSELRRRVLEASPSAIPVEDAERHLAEREERLIAAARNAAADADEPTTFRVPVPKRVVE